MNTWLRNTLAGPSLLWAGLSAFPLLSACQTTQPADARIVRAEAYTRAEAWVEAASLWGEIYRSSGAQDRRAGLASARALLASGEGGVAGVRLGEMSERWPLDPEILEALGLAREDQGELAGARTAYAAALAVDPSRPVALARVGVLGDAAGVTMAAHESLGRLRAKGALGDTDPDSLFSLGLAAARAGRMDQAYEALDLALRSPGGSRGAGGSGSASRRLAAARALAPDPRVIPWLRAVVEEDPLHTSALTLLGTTQATAGYGDRALRTLEQAVSSDPSDGAAVRAYAEALDRAGLGARAAEVRALLPQESSTAPIDPEGASPP